MINELKTITSLEFHNDDNKNLRNCIKILENHCGKVELVSYGLVPNVNGFCYEILDHNLGGTIEINQIESALESLDSEQVKVLRELYL